MWWLSYSGGLLHTSRLFFASTKPATLLRMKTTTLICFTLMMTACATPDGTHRIGSSSVIAKSQKQAGTQIAQAATSPLNDLNLVQADIPPALIAALREPYVLAADHTCLTLADEIKTLDSVLGADLDAPATEENPSLIERGVVDVNNAAYKALRKAAEGLTPYRGWVRKLTGAERYSQKVAAAIAAGTIRRSFLKGVGQASGCVAPAAPYGLLVHSEK